MHTPLISYECGLGSLPQERRSGLYGLSPVEDTRWNYRLDNAVFYVVAWHDDLPVGFAFAENPTGDIGVSWEKYVPGALEFGGVIVRPEYRRQGIMAEMVRLRIHMALDLGRQPVCVTLADNDNVINYYSSRGWTPRKPFYRNEVKLIPWVMEKQENERGFQLPG